MTNTVTDALKQLTTIFTVKDIMTPRSRLICAPDAEAAPGVSAANPDFSVIPIKKEDELTGYFERDAKQAYPIVVGDLVSDGTPLLDLVDILQEKEFSFVLAHQDVDGYVHYSDLNHQMVKWTFYVMLEAVERLALEKLGHLCLAEGPVKARGYLQEKLGSKRFEQIAAMYQRAGDNGRSLMTYLNLADILRLAVSEGVLQLNESSIPLMKDVRDWAAHVLYDLPAETAVRNLEMVKRECLRLLGSTAEGEAIAASA
jgi:hypothetical protein